MQKWNKVVLNYRASRGWTQEQMAVFCRVSRYTIIRIESGDYTPHSRVRGLIESAMKQKS